MKVHRFGGILAAGLALWATACIDPADQRPGLRLTGEVAPLPADWSFTQDHREIFVEVGTPYLLPHSVTIWCIAMDGDLYVGARDPEHKRWPGWVDADPNVRLQIGERIYEVALAPLEDEDALGRLIRAYTAKYDMPASTFDSAPPIRFWRVLPRS